MPDQSINVEKLNLLYAAAAQRRRAMERNRDDIRAIAAELSHLQASLTCLKDGAAGRSEIEQQIAELMKKKSDLETQQDVVQQEWNETTRLRQACEEWLQNKGYPIPANASSAWRNH